MEAENWPLWKEDPFCTSSCSGSMLLFGGVFGTQSYQWKNQSCKLHVQNCWNPKSSYWESKGIPSPSATHPKKHDEKNNPFIRPYRISLAWWHAFWITPWIWPTSSFSKATKLHLLCFSERRILVGQTLVPHVTFKTSQQQKESPFFWEVFWCFFVGSFQPTLSKWWFKYVLIFTLLGERIQFD